MHRTRRQLIAMAGGLAAAGLLAKRASAQGAPVLRFGLTPVFLTSDLDLLDHLQAYLEAATARNVQLVTRRTYQEITALLVSGQLDGAWICGYPFVAYRAQLELLAVPVWRAKPLYQSYLITDASRAATGIEDLAGDVHAFSDPDSNSGFLVTAAELARKGQRPERFFRQVFFTYGHRNVVRAVASGLAQSGSVDGYVYEVLSEVEPSLTSATRIVRASDWYGFPPIACPASAVGSDNTERLRAALLAMHENPTGQQVLKALQLQFICRGTTLALRSDRRKHVLNSRPRMSRFTSSLGRVPITIKVPVVVAVLMTAVGVVASQQVLSRLVTTQERQIKDLTNAYLDGLASPLVEPVLRGDPWEIFDVLDQARQLYADIRPIETVVTDGKGVVLAGSKSSARANWLKIASRVSSQSRAYGNGAHSRTRLASLVDRNLVVEGRTVGKVHAEFDISPLLAERRGVAWTLISTNGALTLLFVLLGWFTVRRMMRPMKVLSDHLEAAQSLGVKPIPPELLPDAESEAGRLFRRFNTMAGAVAENVALAARLSDEERLASLGRLASGMAHEINNPLGGLFNAIDTLRKHGDKSLVVRSRYP